jgi:D-sedoheptulose 7-phosphate isomerase
VSISAPAFTAQYLERLQLTLASLDQPRVEQAIEWFRHARDEQRTIFVCGNGGSASTASHFACDMVKGASYQRDRRIRIQALTDSLPTLTAYANDVGYDVVFAEQLRNFARPGDLVMAISGSGNSPNVLRAVETARELGCRTIGLTGRDGGKLGAAVDLHIHAAEPHMGRIEDAHMIICHIIAYAFMDQPGR